MARAASGGWRTRTFGLAGALALWLAAASGAQEAPSGTLALIVRPTATQGSSELYLMTSSGSAPKRCDTSARRVNWSPDGRRLLLYEGTGPAPGRIWVLAPWSADPPGLLFEKGAEPAWSPDSRMVALTKEGGGIVSAAIDGQAAREVSGAERGYAPAWTPDGKALAFARASGGGGSIWAISAGGGQAERLAFCARPLALAWSPDGRSLAVLEHDHERMRSPRLSVFERGMAAPRALAAVAGDMVRWSPDGMHILVTGSGGGSLIAAANGSEAIRLQADETAVGSLPSGELVTVCAGPAQVRAIGPSGRRPLHGFAQMPRGRTIWSAWTAAPPPPSATAAAADRARPDTAAVVRPAASRGAASPATAVVVPMVFPVCGPVQWTDSFLASRDGGKRRHQGQDIIAPRMRETVAAFDGVVIVHRASTPGGHNWLVLAGDNGWTATYLHLNNDTPGTDDGLGGDLYAFAPGIETGVRVQAGQLLGWVGDSGNAENTTPHLHFELAPTATHIAINAAPSLEAAERLESPRPVTVTTQPPDEVAGGSRRAMNRPSVRTKPTFVGCE